MSKQEFKYVGYLLASAGILLALAIFFYNSSLTHDNSIDQCLRVEIFKTCIISVKETGKEITTDSLVKECRIFAYNAAKRPIEQVTPECRLR